MLANTFAYHPDRLHIGLGLAFSVLFPTRPSLPIPCPLRGVFFFSPDIPAAERAKWFDRTADEPISAYGYRMRLLARVDLRAHLRKLHVPVPVIAAADDRVVLSQAGRELTRLLPQARLWMPCVGHAALIHPCVDMAAVLADPRYWAPSSAEPPNCDLLPVRPGIGQRLRFQPRSVRPVEAPANHLREATRTCRRVLLVISRQFRLC